MLHPVFVIIFVQQLYHTPQPICGTVTHKLVSRNLQFQLQLGLTVVDGIIEAGCKGRSQRRWGRGEGRVMTPSPFE